APEGGLKVARLRELAAVPVATANARASVPKNALKAPSRRAVHSSSPYGLASPRLAPSRAVRISGQAVAVLSLKKRKPLLLENRCAAVRGHKCAGALSRCASGTTRRRTRGTPARWRRGREDAARSARGPRHRASRPGPCRARGRAGTGAPATPPS